MESTCTIGHVEGGRSFDRPRPQRDHPNSLCLIRFHFIHHPTDYTLSIFLLRTSPSLSPISYRRLHPIFVIPGVGYRMMGEATVSPLFIGYSPINSACGTLLFSFSHPPSCGLSPITCLRVTPNASYHHGGLSNTFLDDAACQDVTEGDKERMRRVLTHIPSSLADALLLLPPPPLLPLR